MKRTILVAALLALGACDTLGFGGSFEIDSSGTRVSPSVSGISGNTRGTVSIDL